MSTSSPQKPLRVLVSGAGIGGPVLAYWLGKAGISVTVLERAKRLRKEGQTVDIADNGIQIIKWMGVEEAIRRLTTKEAGFHFVDTNNKLCATFPQTENGASLTREIEIVRGELATIFYEASKEKAEYIFGDTIATIQETEKCAQVTFASNQTREFDIVIVTEGLLSPTRAKIFNEDVRAPLRPLNLWVVSFSYEQGKTDSQWARYYNATRRRGILVRPDGFGRTRALAQVIDKSGKSQAVYDSRDETTQREHFINLFKDAGWEADRIMTKLSEADDLYVQEVAQAKCKTWSKGRVVLVGDTAYCPSPLSGMGTTAAIVGAYVLAAEIVRHQHDHRAAFAAYEATLRPWINDIQKIPPGAPAIALPETQWGIRVLHAAAYVVSLLSKSGVIGFISRIVAYFNFGVKLKLPDRAVFEQPAKPIR